jgi:hypothetical protein
MIPSLIAVLTVPVRYLFVEDVSDTGDIYIEGRSCVDSGLGSWSGFYDWLRQPSGRIIGVRTWHLTTHPNTEDFRDHLVSNPAIEWGDGSFTLWFSDQREFDPGISDDQEFGIHRLVTSSDCTWFLTYDVGMMSELELTQIVSLSPEQLQARS